MRNLILAALLPLALAGCGAAGAIVSVATAPIKVASKAADLATTSQSETDEKRGREMRCREARIGALDHEYRRQSEKCTTGDAKACARRDAAYDAMLSMP